VLLDEWVPAAAPIKRDEALAMLAQRYFAHHGPATLADFVWWSGLTVADAKRSIDAAGSSLTAESCDDTIWWSGVQPRIKRGPSSHLLPVYDEYTVGYADRSACLDPAHAERPEIGHGIFRAPVIVDGRIVGTWSRTLGKKEVEVRVTPLGQFTKDRKQAIEAAAERYGRFLGLGASVSFDKPRRARRS
jgi:DNA glycosylase AlkZ-like